MLPTGPVLFELSAPDNSSSLNTLIGESCWEPFSLVGGKRGRINCSFVCMSLFCQGLSIGSCPCRADGLVRSVTQLLQASFRKEEVPQVGVLSFRHWGDDWFFFALIAKVTTQWFLGFHCTTEELSLQLSVSLSIMVTPVSRGLWPLGALSNWNGWESAYVSAPWDRLCLAFTGPCMFFQCFGTREAERERKLRFLFWRSQHG